MTRALSTKLKRGLLELGWSVIANPSSLTCLTKTFRINGLAIQTWAWVGQNGVKTAPHSKLTGAAENRALTAKALRAAELAREAA